MVQYPRRASSLALWAVLAVWTSACGPAEPENALPDYEGAEARSGGPLAAADLGPFPSSWTYP